MRNMRGAGAQGLAMAALLSFAGQVHAACNGPQAMVTQLRAHPAQENAVALGNWYATRQQFDCAIDAFRSGLRIAPNSAQLHYLVGLALVAEKRLPQALPELQRSTQLEATVLNPHLLLASLYDELNKPADAESEWRKALAIDPKSEEALQGISKLYIRREDYPSVILLLQNAPHTEGLTITLSKAFGLMGYLDQAEAVLNEALKENRDSMPLAQAMSVVLIRERKYEEALKLQRVIVSVHPGDVDALEDFFRMAVLANHIDEARPIGPKLLEARPHDPQVLYLNGVVQRAVGDYPGAKKFLEEAVTLQPEFFNSQYHLGMVLVLLHEWAEAKVHLEKAIALGAPQAETHFELAKALRGLGDNQRAAEELKIYQQMKKVDEVRLEAAEASAQGDTELREGKITEAVAHFREAVEGQPANGDYRYRLALALHRAKDETGEREQLEQAIKLDPKLAGAHNQLGYLLTRAGDAPAAVQQFRAAVAVSPNWTEAWVNLAAELAETGQFADARQAVTRALTLEPANAQARELSDQLAHDPRAQTTHP